MACRDLRHGHAQYSRMKFSANSAQSLVTQEAPRGATVNRAERKTYHSGTD
jgi:hypothetical protein